MSKPILVSGAGIGGLSFALACFRAKLPVMVFERASLHQIRQSIHKGSGIGLWGPSLRALRSLGIDQQVEQHGKFLHCAGYRSYQDGKWLVQPDLHADINRSALYFDFCRLVSSLPFSFFVTFKIPGLFVSSSRRSLQ
jgi:2-polyprenyl-6-methoxyphenol hydroxylase-like FAD-dependent oxidoreductase